MSSAENLTAFHLVEGSAGSCTLRAFTMRYGSHPRVSTIYRVYRDLQVEMSLYHISMSFVDSRMRTRMQHPLMLFLPVTAGMSWTDESLCTGRWCLMTGFASAVVTCSCFASVCFILLFLELESVLEGTSAGHGVPSWLSQGKTS